MTLGATSQLRTTKKYNKALGGGFSGAIGIGESSLSLCYDSTNYEFMFGINKIGVTIGYEVDFGNRTAGTYYHEYIRTIPIAGAGAVIYYTKGAALPYFREVLVK